MSDDRGRLRVFAGDCVIRFKTAGDRDADRLQRGRVVVLVKPDRTVLVHDADGYQPAAWLTRPDSVTVEADGDGFAITARADERTLRVVSRGPGERRDLPVGPAGVPVGRCPRCADGRDNGGGDGCNNGGGDGRDGDGDDERTGGGAGRDSDVGGTPDGGGALVRTRGEVACLDCGDRYGLPAGATVLDPTCEECGLPLLRVERGEAFELCLDRACESLAEAVRERLDRRWSCPDCGRDLRIRGRGDRLFLGCAGYPDCETAFSLPAGVTAGRCDCGLPLFETAIGRRCLDGTCDRFRGGDG